MVLSADQKEGPGIFMKDCQCRVNKCAEQIRGEILKAVRGEWQRWGSVEIILEELIDNPNAVKRNNHE